MNLLLILAVVVGMLYCSAAICFYYGFKKKISLCAFIPSPEVLARLERQLRTEGKRVPRWVIEGQKKLQGAGGKTMSSTTIGSTRVKKVSLLAIISLGLLALASAAPAGASDDYPFQTGSARFSLLIGSATAFDQSYTVFGLGFGYYVMDGLEAGLDVETWRGNTPHISRVSPGFRYVFHSKGIVKPYAGAFYRRTSIQGFQNQNDAGVRAGGIVAAGRRAYFGAGAVYDAHINCDRTVYSSCSEIYPELQVAIIF